MNDFIDKSNWTGLLQSVEFFKPFVKGELDAMLDASVVKKYSARSIIIRENAEEDCFYVILSGKARVIKKDKHDVSQIISLLAAGDCFGEMAILLDEPRIATIVSETECAVFKINKDEIDKLPMETMGKLYRQFAIMISKRLKYNLAKKLPSISSS